jgi:spore maturation protein CgeB
MRIVVLGAGGARKTEASIVRAARALGHPCRLVNTVRWSRGWASRSGRVARFLLDEFQPEFLILTRHAIRLGEPTLKTMLRGRKAVFWYFDFQPSADVIRLGRLVGSMAVTYLGQIELYRNAGIDSLVFLPQGVDPYRDVPAAFALPWERCDTSFVGSGQYPYRHELLRAVSAVSRLHIRGPGWENASQDLPVVGGPVYGQRLARIIRGAAISLGASAYPEQDADRASASNRMWKILGCGGFYLGRHVPDIEAFAADGEHCAWYRTSAEAAELTRHYLDRPDERARIARTGRAHALAHHTYAHRLQLLIQGTGYPLHTIL